MTSSVPNTEALERERFKLAEKWRGLPLGPWSPEKDLAIVDLANGVLYLAARLSEMEEALRAAETDLGRLEYAMHAAVAHLAIRGDLEKAHAVLSDALAASPGDPE